MKNFRQRFSSLVLLLFLCFALSCMAEDTDRIDLTALSSKHGFEWEGENWLYQRETYKIFSDGSIRVGLEATVGKEKSEVLVALFAGIPQQINGSLNKIEMIIGKSTWTWHGLIPSGEYAYALLGPEETDFLSALAEAEDIQVQLSVLTKKITLELKGDELRPLQEAASQLIACNVIQSVQTTEESTTGTYLGTYPVHRHNYEDDGAGNN